MSQVIILEAKLVRAAQANQGVGDIRHYLNGILLAANGDIVATDGHTMFHAPNATEAGTLEHDTIIQIDGKITVSVETVSIDLSAMTARTDKGKLFAVTVVDGKFPEYHRVMPGSERKGGTEAHALHFDGTLLERAAATFGKGERVDLHLPPTEHDSMVITSPAIEGGSFIIMPMRA
jgi:hypothetical protein